MIAWATSVIILDLQETIVKQIVNVGVTPASVALALE